jgi:hypothetical protein
VDALRDERAVEDRREGEREEERGDGELAGHARRRRRAGSRLNETLVPRQGTLSARTTAAWVEM